MNLPHDGHIRPSRLGVFLAVWGEVIFVAIVAALIATLIIVAP